MDDFTLSVCGGFPSQEVIVGGDCGLLDEFDLSPDISSFVKEEVIFEDIDSYSGLTSSGDDLSPLPAECPPDEEIFNVRKF